VNGWLTVPSVIVKIAPEVGFKTVVTTVDEYVLVAVLQAPGVAIALTEQTPATEQEIGAI
jgi:hypothetical protein